MATRRNVAAQKAISEAQGGPSTSTQVSDTSPAVPASVIYKLLGFTMAMIFFPIGSYFLSVNLVFGGNATYAGAFAAIMANVVLVAYIIVAMKEDQTDKIEAGKKGKKTQ
ncbi:vacuolar ATPase assembly integral membrane protein vma21 [Exophiala dermatitidis]|uniref:Vacuolar ATPase assembly integral membrane protein vma21 n=1 Tax=Exophiala dermatitidis TaxID=5970 RepID=A0AAN6EU25_EXODE|nr:vacuolar ATPase assembly integral membrane protein vma21 [Exophiala dermatitidis]KAJ4535553.1 vacuolar ATPase assembly integral membrane protein vma21 [Exophiala dermatitidis]KAJ4544477.1 vacuolar ATPase assembly integral membrane protein vma21 [Exophiala dermatitidis]KAJ4561459.1 vacuolar ATPase assembly integral membrane protein vma21 [Exophiala dermatitidis]KAJ4563579.1 vacuolar ATPase assembly integral membrane protein vma21 [Exophiala dermatitidis]